MKICTVDGCPEKHLARGYCSSHYNKLIQPDRHRTKRACERCGGAYVTTRTNGRFCSLACRDSHRRDAFLPVHIGPAWPRCDVPARHPSRRPEPRRPEWWKLLVAGDCAWCGAYFVGCAAYAEGAPIYCSRPCQRSAGKSRRGRFVVPPTVRAEIYERDEWTCQLCREPVDPTLPVQDQWAATLDHIVCQSWSEDPDHSPENLRLAHRWCNSVRNDERYVDASFFD